MFEFFYGEKKSIKFEKIKIFRKKIIGKNARNSMEKNSDISKKNHWKKCDKFNGKKFRYFEKNHWKKCDKFNGKKSLKKNQDFIEKSTVFEIFQKIL